MTGERVRRVASIAAVLFAVYLAMSAAPAAAAGTAMVSQQTSASELAQGTTANSEVERGGEDGYVGHDTYTSSAEARWAFDEGEGSTVNDHVGQHHGSRGSAQSWSSDGVSGGSMHFDGTGAIATGYNPDDIDGTISYWVRYDELTGSIGVHDGQYTRFYIGFNGSGAFIAGAGDEYREIDNHGIETGGWHHIALSNDNGNARAYVDGSPVANFNYGVRDSNTEEFLIGARNYAGADMILNGSLDETRIYSEPLTASQISQLHDSPGTKLSSRASERWAGDEGLGETVGGDGGVDGTFDTAPGDAIFTMPFNEGAGHVAYDSAGSHDGDVTGATWTGDGALAFDGSGDMVRSGDVDVSGGFAVSATVDYEDDPGTLDIIATKGSSHNGAEVFNLFTDDSRARFAFRDSGGTTRAFFNGVGPDLSERGPTRVTGAYNGSHLFVYINGSVVAQKDVGSQTLNSNDADLQIGARDNGGNPDNAMSGTIDDVRVYDSFMTPGEVRRPAEDTEVKNDASATERWAFDEQQAEEVGRYLHAEFRSDVNDIGSIELSRWDSPAYHVDNLMVDGAIVDDFEDGDLSEWSGTSGFHVNDTEAIGEWSIYREPSASDIASRSFSTDTHDSVSFTLKADSYADTPRLNINGASGTGPMFVVNSGNLQYYNGSGYVDTDIDVPAETWVRIEVFNIDYASNTYDIRVVDVEGGTAYGDEDGDMAVDEAEWTPGVAGGALDFSPNENESARTESVSDIPAGSENVTYSAWVKHEAEGTGQIMGWEWSDPHGILIAGDGTLRFNVYDSSSELNTYDASTQLPTGTWSHVAVTYDGSEARFYIDGSLDSTHSVPTAQGQQYSNFDIGSASAHGAYDQTYMQIDEARVYSRVVTADEVSRLAGNPVVQLDKAHYGNEWVDGMSGSAMKFDGDGEHVEAGAHDFMSKNNDFSTSFWLNVEDNATTQNPIYNVIGSNDRFGITVHQGTVRAGVYDGSTYVSTAEADMPEDEWVHVATVFEGGDMSLYVNGAEHEGGDQPILSGNSGFAIGAQPNLNRALNGSMDDVNIYDDALSQREIQYLESRPGAQLNETSTYSVSHDAGESVRGHADLELENATAEVTWRTGGGAVLNSSIYSSTGNKSLTWDRSGADSVELEVTFEAQDPEHTARLHGDAVYAETRDPEVDDSSLSPDTSTTLESAPTLEADVSDPDFGEGHGDEVTLEWYMDGTRQGTTSVTSNGTSTYGATANAGNHDWYVEASDSYGNGDASDTASFGIPSDLRVYNETEPESLIDDITVDIEFYFNRESGEPDLVETRSTDNGTLSMDELPADEPFVVVASADDHFNRRIYVPSLYETQSIYLLNENRTSVQPTFTLTDFTGRYPTEDTVIEVQRSMNGTWRTVEGDFFGSANEMSAQLEFNERHRTVVTNVKTGDTRNLGVFTPTNTQMVELEVHQDDSVIGQDTAPFLVTRPDTGSLPAASGVEVTADMRPGDRELRTYNIKAVLSDGTELHQMGHSQADGGEHEFAVDLSGAEDQEVTVWANWTATDGSDAQLSRTYEVSGHTPNQYSLISVLTGASVGDGTPNVLTTMLTVTSALLVTGYAASSMDSGPAGLAGMGVITAGAIISFIPWVWVATGGLAWLVLVGVRNRL